MARPTLWNIQVSPANCDLPIARLKPTGKVCWFSANTQTRQMRNLIGQWNHAQELAKWTAVRVARQTTQYHVFTERVHRKLHEWDQSLKELRLINNDN